MINQANRVWQLCGPRSQPCRCSPQAARARPVRFCSSSRNWGRSGQRRTLPTSWPTLIHSASCSATSTLSRCLWKRVQNSLSTRSSNAATDGDLEDQDFLCDRRPVWTLRPHCPPHPKATPVLFISFISICRPGFFLSRALPTQNCQEHAEKSRLGRVVFPKHPTFFHRRASRQIKAMMSACPTSLSRAEEVFPGRSTGRGVDAFNNSARQVALNSCGLTMS